MQFFYFLNSWPEVIASGFLSPSTFITIAYYGTHKMNINYLEDITFFTLGSVSS